MQSEYELPPGHASVRDEKMLRVGRGEPTAKQYVQCHRVVRYVQSQDVFVEQIRSDAGCTRFEKYGAGVLVIPRRDNLDWP